MLNIYAEAISIGIIIVILLRYAFPFRGRRTVVIPSSNDTVAGIHSILSPPHTSIEEQLLRRALPNQRLVRAFAVTNTFVSCDTGIRTDFRENADRLLHAAGDWRHLQDLASQAAELSLPLESIPYNTFIGGLTLRFVLVGLLQVPASIDSFDSADIDFVTRTITDLWALSKRPEQSDSARLDRLNHHLRILVPDREQYPNPLDFVIPAWETMWRVVAATVAHTRTDLAARQAFADLRDQPTFLQFRHVKNSGLSVGFIIAETLRLHPPSRHIYRSVENKLQIADIEGVQVSRSIWGENAGDFKPRRHAELTQEQKSSLMSFGYGQLKCPAVSWAPLASAIVVAEVLHRVDDAEYLLRAGGDLGRREGWEGWAVDKV
ncbi:hypothetical protein C8J56DRAFT_917362 [Mycena floridula]|nr:hypothetical protein C8J56DRAFT_917362 [Mycena floridula]